MIRCLTAWGRRREHGMPNRTKGFACTVFSPNLVFRTRISIHRPCLGILTGLKLKECSAKTCKSISALFTPNILIEQTVPGFPSLRKKIGNRSFTNYGRDTGAAPIQAGSATEPSMPGSSLEGRQANRARRTLSLPRLSRERTVPTGISSWSAIS